MDIRSVNPGHLLVVPTVHAAGLADLPLADGERACLRLTGFAYAQRQAPPSREELDQTAVAVRQALTGM